MCALVLSPGSLGFPVYAAGHCEVGGVSGGLGHYSNIP